MDRMPGQAASPVTPARGLATATAREGIVARYGKVRDASAALAAPLEVEDYVLQAAPYASPSKWHLAHTTWFFETFVLLPFAAGYKVFQPQYAELFNSYYNGIGPQFPRPRRGTLSRPTVQEVGRYRKHVDSAMAELFDHADEQRWPAIAARTLLGCQHEEQHQELFLTDIKYNLSVNPLAPAYRTDLPAVTAPSGRELRWHGFAGGKYEIGQPGAGFEFAFDNETPRHPVLLQDFAIATRLVNNGEYLAFIEDGAYRRPELWLSDGWATVGEGQWRAPLYWSQRDGGWWLYTLGGMRPLDEQEPVCHVSFYEADAYARWAHARLPSEAEWEVVAARYAVDGNLRESGRLHPRPATVGGAVAQLFGDAWEWTDSSYRPYPRYRPESGAIGEYCGKFMINQMVLRGGSCVTPRDHIRASYRNFFYPADRWQFSGIRLAKDT
jgi:ergothioneine biosynthesis protein EgtB